MDSLCLCLTHTLLLVPGFSPKVGVCTDYLYTVRGFSPKVGVCTDYLYTYHESHRTVVCRWLINGRLSAVCTLARRLEGRHLQDRIFYSTDHFFKLWTEKTCFWIWIGSGSQRIRYRYGGIIKDEYYSWVQYKSGPGGGRRCKKSTLNDLPYLTPLRIPLMNPVEEYRAVSCVFEHIDPSLPGECVLPPQQRQSFFSRLPKYWPTPLSARRVCTPVHTRRAERGVGQYFGRREKKDCPLTVIISLRSGYSETHGSASRSNKSGSSTLIL